MMSRKVWIALIIFILFLGVEAYAFGPTVRSSLNKKEIAVGEKVKLTVEMEWKQEKDTSIVVTQITPPSSALLKQVDSKQRVSSRLTKNGVFAERILEYFYIGKEEGTGDITPAVVEYAFSDNPENKRIIKSQPISIKVISRAAGFWKTALKNILGIISAVLLFALLALLKKFVISLRSNKRKETGGDSAGLEKKFCEKLRDLNEHKVSGDTGAYYAGLEKALCDYIKKKYNGDMSAENMAKLPQELQKICAECKLMAEKVRFSGYRPQEDEQDRLIRGITKYMKSLIPGEDEQDSIETIDLVGEKVD